MTHFTLGTKREALEETVRAIRATVAGFNELYPALCADYERFAVEQKAREAATQAQIAADQEVINRLMAES